MLALRGISPSIDTCVGLIRNRAGKAYRRVSEDHRRWIDPEDLVQEGLLAAVEAENRYDPWVDALDGTVPPPTSRAKYSTYLHTGLMHHFTRTLAPLRLQKRVLRKLTELDAPIPLSDGDAHMDLPDTQELQDVACDRSHLRFGDICRWLSPDAASLLASRLLCSEWFGIRYRPSNEEALTKEIRYAADKLGLQIDDFRRLAKDEKMRKKALTVLGSAVSLDTDARVLECVKCRGQFGLSAIQSGRYVVETLTCGVCYRGMMAADANLTCFGKEKTSEHEGYSESDIECRMHCVDRKVCRAYITQKDGSMKATATAPAQATDALGDDLTDVDLSGIETPAAPKSQKTKEAKPKKAAEVKAKAADVKAKATKFAKSIGVTVSDEDEKDEKAVPVPAELGPKWPFKDRSAWQYAFKRAYAGVPAAELRKEMEGKGYGWKLVLEVLRRRHREHRYENLKWKLDESGGMLKIYDVRYVGKDADGGKDDVGVGKEEKPVKKTTAKKAAGKKEAAPKPKKEAAKPRSATSGEPRDGSKGAKLMTMLRSKTGATREQMVKATEWVDHSVRGFLSGAPKRYGVVIISAKNDKGDRYYKIQE